MSDFSLYLFFLYFLLFSFINLLTIFLVSDKILDVFLSSFLCFFLFCLPIFFVYNSFAKPVLKSICVILESGSECENY